MCAHACACACVCLLCVHVRVCVHALMTRQIHVSMCTEKQLRKMSTAFLIKEAVPSPMLASASYWRTISRQVEKSTARRDCVGLEQKVLNMCLVIVSLCLW